MPVTLQNLLEDRSLGLRCAVAPADPDREIGWVHASELADPTTYLDGGELLLSTGIGPDAAGPVRYADRLADHGLVGLGFGTGLGHDEIPPVLVAACERRGLGLLEIPERTPFIAITKAVSAALAADSYAQVVRTDEAQRALTAAALGRSGARRVLRGLADRLSAWVFVSDTDGAVRHAVPRSAAHRAGDLLREVRRVRGRRGPASAGLVDGDVQVVLQAVRMPDDAVLAVGRDVPFSPVDLQVIGSAVALLTLLHARTSDVGRAERRLRTAMLRAAFATGGVDVRAIAGDLWGPVPAGPVRVVALRRRSGGTAPLLEALEDAAGRGGPHLFGEIDDRVVALVADGAVDSVTERARRRTGVRAGVSEPVEDEDLATGLRQAVRAVEAAARLDRPVVRFVELAGEGLRALVGDRDAAAFAESALAPLLAHDARGRGDLVASLREWLAHHGQWDPAAANLGVHRHTLRARIEKAARLLERDLDSPGVRADLWFALQAHDRPEGAPD